MNLKLSDRTIVRITGFSYILAILFMISVFFIASSHQIPFKKITGDPALTFGSNPLVGFVSNIGVLLWCMTASICLFSSFILWFENQPKESKFLGFSGLITGILLVDDFFMIHDYIFYSLGLHQYVMYSIYLVIFATYFMYFKAKILSSANLLLLIFAFIFLGGSLGMDILIKSEGIAYFFEDALKFLGITSWFLFFTTTCFYRIISKLPQGKPTRHS